MPLDDDFQDLLKSSVADLKNVGGKWGGAVTAAKFLQQFVDGRPWVHLDIAGPSWAESERLDPRRRRHRLLRPDPGHAHGRTGEAICENHHPRYRWRERWIGAVLIMPLKL